MSSEELKGVVVNGKVISAIVGCISIIGVLFSSVGYVTYQGFELTQAKEDLAKLETKVDTQVAKLQAQLEASNQQSRQDFKQILDQVQNLTGEVTKLTIAVGNVQYKQDNTPPKQ
ncbi:MULTISPECIES: spore coat protein [unclassified Mesorhizobium]|uniref:spore coat protein n=1 Tax=unclassified Mesorhizobium TaxID=325217 RepID=UPI00112B96A6|nr:MULTISPECIES: spore coat protein [unclassified Mesorhizobium]TPL42631.1 M3 family oligoendopeptidase [Mesorhizobium sp. B2-4-5]TPL66634.1 M3 family oligoendopeptidase [Mesorhizobium sp. B2-4-1]